MSKDLNTNKITYFAETDFRNKQTPFGIKASDRSRHVYIIGKTGMGKSTLLENMAAQDLKNGNGMCFIDPHGSAIETLIDYIPEERIEDVILFAPGDTENPISFNVMEDVGPEKRHLVAQGLLSAFKKIWGAETFSDRMEHIVNNTLLALLEYPGATMLSIPRIFVDTDFQKDVIKHITDPSVKNFWTKEYASWDDRYRKDAYSAVLNKVGQFTSNPIIRNIVGQPKSTFDFREVIEKKKILLINLSIGQIGEANADLLGSMMSTKVFLTAMERADMEKQDLAKAPNFYLYIDEFQNLANDSFADILAQARKYKLNLTMAHQYIEQMPDTVRAAVFGNVGTMVTFRIGSIDAEAFEKEFAPTFYADDLVNLGFAQIYLRLMIDGIGSQPFSARTLPPIEKPVVSFRDEVIEASRKQFSRPKQEVEDEINEWNDKSFKVSRATVDKDGNKLSKKGNINKKGNNLKKNNNFKQNNKFNKKPQPELEGSDSLKDALATALNNKKEEVVRKNPRENFKEREKTNHKNKEINSEIETENKKKLKAVLDYAVTKNNKENEEQKTKEVSEEKLRKVLE